MKREIICILAAFALAGCSEKETEREKGFGTMRIVCAADAQIETAPLSRAEVLPEGSEFVLRIQGGEIDRQWERVADFTAENPLFKEGRYTATASYGEPGSEGAGLPYFTGRQEVAVEARRSSEVQIVARPGKDQAVVRATEQFLAYYHDIHFTLTTGSGNTFPFDLDTEGYAESAVYVKAGTVLTVAGTARRQSQTGTDEGLQVTFAPVTVEAAEVDPAQKRKRHIFTFDFKQGGGATLTIQIGEDYVETVEVVCELNDDAII